MSSLEIIVLAPSVVLVLAALASSIFIGTEVDRATRVSRSHDAFQTMRSFGLLILVGGGVRELNLLARSVAQGEQPSLLELAVASIGVVAAVLLILLGWQARRRMRAPQQV